MTTRYVLSRRPLLAGLAAASVVAPAAAMGQARAAARSLQVFKTPGCGCCEGWAEHLRANGFACEVTEHAELARVKDRLGVPESLRSCHTGTLEGYVVEGHVPAAALERLLIERPAAVAGLAVPGMPMGSPGMPSPHPEAYEVVAFGADGSQRTFMRFVGEAIA
ncbi:MAG TPA: DUF411 domain-containing protein [Geminicoccaceae bacterium]|nr:DUF411 domain-containing protein [Geminicoccaceae bacterium]